MTGSALCSGRSSLKRISRPLLRKAIICSRSRIVREENSRVSKTVPSGQKVTVVPVRPRGRVADDRELAGDLAAVGEGHLVALAVAVDLDDQLGGQRVHHGHADAVEAAGDLVAALAAELPAAVELGEGDLDAGHLLLLVDVGGDPAPVVDDADAAVGEEGDVDPAGVAGHGLVDGVVDDLPDAVVEAAHAGAPDVHPRPLADGIEPLQDLHAVGPVGPLCLRQATSVSAGGLGARSGRAETGGQTGRRSAKTLVRPPNHNPGILPAQV